MRVPISPDGIPMVNLAQPIEKDPEQVQERRNAFSEMGRKYDTMEYVFHLTTNIKISF